MSIGTGNGFDSGAGSTTIIQSSGSLPQDFKIRVVKSNSATEYSTIAAAISGSLDGDTIFLGKGPYLEGDLRIPAGVDINAPAGCVIAGNGTNTTLYPGAGTRLVGDLTIVAPNVSGTYGVKFEKNGSRVIGELAVSGSGNNATPICVGATNGSAVETTVPGGVFVAGTFKEGYVIRPGGTWRAVNTGITENSSGSTGISIQGGTFRTNFLSARIRTGDVDTGVKLQNSGSVADISNAKFINYNDAALEIVSEDIELDCRGSVFVASNFDIRIDSSLSGTNSTVKLIYCDADISRFSIPASYVANSNWLVSITSPDNFGNEDRLQLMSELSVGTADKGYETTLGGGDSYTRGLLVYQSSSAGGFVDVSDNARNFLSGTFSFPANENSASLYVSSDLFNSNDYVRFPGLKISLDSTGTIGSGSIDLNYWSSTGWSDSPYSIVTDDDNQFLPKGDRVGLDGVAQQLRFCQRFIDNFWEKSDPIGSGTDRYWIRLIMSGTAYDTLPQFKQFKLHTNRSEFEADGYQQYYGASRPLRLMPWNIGDARPAFDSPANQDMYLSDNLAVGREENRLRSSSDDQIGIAVKLPSDTDTGCLIALEVLYVPTSNDAGNCTINVKWAYSVPDQDSVYTNSAGAPTTFRNEQSKSADITIEAGERYKLKSQVIFMNIKGAIPYRAEPEQGDILWVSYAREGTNVADTYSGNLSILDIGLKYLAWNNGVHPTFSLNNP